MFFAQSEFTAPVGLAAWLGCASFVLLLVNQAFKLKANVSGRNQQREILPQPLEVAAVTEYVPASAFAAHVAENRREHENLFAKIGGVDRGLSQRLDLKLDTMQRAAEEGREKLHDRINDVLSAVSELRGTVNEMRKI
jgi:hypothetical protein